MFSGFRAHSQSRGANKHTGRAATPQDSLPAVPSTPQQQQTRGRPSDSAQPPSSSSDSVARSTGTTGMASTEDDMLSSYSLPKPLPVWLNPAYAKHIVKGNFMTLSARPKTVEQGEWMAHQCVEHYRNLWHFVRVVYEKEEDGSNICNAFTCPKMSAGLNHSYTWLNSRHEPVELPAREYMTLMQRWISSKLDDTRIFPTDPTGVSFAPSPSCPPTGVSTAMASPRAGDWPGRRSGFPPEFQSICQTIFLQMFRLYAHLYHAHFVDPFYHLNLEKQLNSCFSHFLLTATNLDLLRPHELEPMQPLVDLWAANGTFPPESKAYQMANLPVGQALLTKSLVQL